MWPDVLQDMVEKIKACLAEVGEEANVYLGASALVPTHNQINVIRGDFKPTGDDTRFCEKEDEYNLVVFVEVWGYAEVDHNDSADDVEHENALTLAGCRETARLSQSIRGVDFVSDVPNYSVEITGREGDQGQFRPTCGERIEYLIELEA